MLELTSLFPSPVCPKIILSSLVAQALVKQDIIPADRELATTHADLPLRREVSATRTSGTNSGRPHFPQKNHSSGVRRCRHLRAPLLHVPNFYRLKKGRWSCGSTCTPMRIYHFQASLETLLATCLTWEVDYSLR